MLHLLVTLLFRYGAGNNTSWSLRRRRRLVTEVERKTLSTTVQGTQVKVGNRRLGYQGELNSTGAWVPYILARVMYIHNRGPYQLAKTIHGRDAILSDAIHGGDAMGDKYLLCGLYIAEACWGETRGCLPEGYKGLQGLQGIARECEGLSPGVFDCMVSLPTASHGAWVHSSC